MSWLATCRRRLRGSPAQRGMTLAVIEGAVVGGFAAFCEIWMVPVLVTGMGLAGPAAGWLTIIPLATTLALSPFVPRIIRALGGNKGAAVSCAAAQIVTLAGLALTLLLGEGQRAAWAGLAIAVLTNIVGCVAGPAYFGWMGDLIPRSIRGRYWSNRMRIFIGAKLAAAASFQAVWSAAGQDHQRAVLFALIVAGAVSRCLSVAMLLRQPMAPPRAATRSRPLPAAAPIPTLTQALWRTDLGRWTAVWSVLHFGVMLAGPFFGPYMLEEVRRGGLDLLHPADQAWRYSVLAYNATFIRLLTLPAMGRLVDRFGPASVLRTAVLVIMVVPVVWATSTSFATLLGIEIASGLGWCAAETAVGVLLLSCHRDPNVRARLISYHQMPVAGIALTANFTGLQLLQQHLLPPLVGSEYRTLFVISMLLRMPAVLLAWRFLPGLEPVPAEWRGVWRLIPGLRPTLTLSRGVIRFIRRADTTD